MKLVEIAGRLRIGGKRPEGVHEVVLVQREVVLVREVREDRAVGREVPPGGLLRLDHTGALLDRGADLAVKNDFETTSYLLFSFLLLLLLLRQNPAKM